MGGGEGEQGEKGNTLLFLGYAAYLREDLRQFLCCHNEIEAADQN